MTEKIQQPKRAEYEAVLRHSRVQREDCRDDRMFCETVLLIEMAEGMARFFPETEAA